MKKIYTFLLLLFINCCNQIDSNSEETFTLDYQTQYKLDNDLLEAVQSNKPDRIKELLEAGANTEQILTTWETLGSGEGCWDYDYKDNLFCYAARHGYSKIIKEFLQVKYDMQDPALDQKDTTILARLYATVIAYIFKTQEPEPADEIYNALLLAAKHTEIIQELLQVRGININRPITYFNDTALIVAAQGNHLKTVQLLIKANADVNQSNKDGDTALIMAIKKHNFEIVQELIKANAKVNQVNEHGNSPLIVAASNREYRDCNQYVKELIKANANINHTNKNGEAALTKAIEHHNINIVTTLLDSREVNINQTDKDGNTPLITAFKCIKTSYIVGNTSQYNDCVNSQQIAELLLNYPGVDPFIANNKGVTAADLLDKYNNPYSF